MTIDDLTRLEELRKTCKDETVQRSEITLLMLQFIEWFDNRLSQIEERIEALESGNDDSMWEME